MCIAVIDIGKTNIKALSFDDDGTVLLERSAPNRSIGGEPYLHFDEPAIWQFILASLRDIDSHHRVRTLVVTTHGAAGALIDDEGLVLPIMDYEELRIDEIESDYAPFRPTFSESLSPPMKGGLNLGRQVFFQSRRHPSAFARALHFLAYPQYWGWKLTGVAAAEATSFGCHTDLWAPAFGRSSSMAQRLGFDRLFPPMRKAFEPLGPLSLAIAQQTGLSADAMVLTGIHDSNASLAMHLSGRDAPFTVVSTGTWIVLLHVGGDLKKLDPAADMMANIDADGRPVACAKFMGGREFAAIANGATGEASMAMSLQLMRQGSFALPSFSDQGGPFLSRRGKITGPALSSDDERLALASLYCALMTDEQLTRLDAKGAIIIDGNFAANEVYCAALAAFRPGQIIETSTEAAGTAKGAAALAVWPAIFGKRNGRIIAPVHEAKFEAYRAQWRSSLTLQSAS
jgi:sugar (pentulose or hexulose) kinase